jgi:hypothetical protein
MNKLEMFKVGEIVNHCGYKYRVINIENEDQREIRLVGARSAFDSCVVDIHDLLIDNKGK